jgi:F-type H+-transporting ATPase subunit gamma
MSKLSALKGRIHSLGDIKSILGAMKNLSIIEMNKVSRFLEAQQKTALAVEDAIADFQDFYGHPQVSRLGSADEVRVLIGSERGFCGSFNETLLAGLDPPGPGAGKTRILTVGRKLAQKTGEDPRVAAMLDGPNTAEEIPAVIVELLGKLAAYPDSKWLFLYHDDGEASGRVSALVPFESIPKSGGAEHSHPPLIQVPPAELYTELLDQYLYFLLYRVFYSSFMAENRQRLQHMEGAIQALERDWNRLMLRFNTLRQEEITEELEVILLSVGAK